MGESEVQSIGGWKDNGEMIADVAKLGFIPGDVLDLTVGSGTFWRVWRPLVLTTNDADLDKKADYHFDFRATPWGSRSVDTVVFDPPYKLGGTPSSPEMDKRYGTEDGLTRAEVLSLLVGGIAEGARLCRKFLLVKCMDQVNGGKVRWQTQVAADTARALELRLVDQFILTGGRKQPAGTSQKHARHEYSTLLVFGRR
jgi:hypothetical protein